MAPKSTAMMHVVTGQRIGQRSSWLARIQTWLDVRRTRIDLSRLTDQQLDDIGLDRDEVQAEISRPIWDVPQNWRRR